MTGTTVTDRAGKPPASPDPNRGTEPAVPAEPARRASPEAPAEPVRGVNPAAPAEPELGVSPAAPAETELGVSPAAAPEPVRSVNPAAPAEPVRGVNPARGAEPTVPGRIRIRTESLPPVRVHEPVDGEIPQVTRPTVFDIRDMSVFYGSDHALGWTSLKIQRNVVTAVIGPSGCGKSTFVRSLNRMNDSIPGFRLTGEVLYHGHDIYGPGVNRVEVRRRIGMVFQEPNPFPKSIYDNVAWAPRNLGMRTGLDELVERALRNAALWDQVKDRLEDSALGLSGGQQQRLCIARAIAIEPDVLLLDEPASALDPVATASIEELMHSLKDRFTIVIVTHNMQQAARVADQVAFFSLDPVARVGTLVECGDVRTIFRNPRDTRTRDYVAGRFG